MTTTFKCKTGEAYQIKVLSELLANNLKDGCFDIDREGVRLRMFDQPRQTLIDLDLRAENFSAYKFESGGDLCLGLNLNHLHKMLKSTKKKDSVQLSFHSERPNDLEIKTIPKENTRVTTSKIMVRSTQNLSAEIPTGYGRPIIVPSPDFQKMCKELSSIGSTDIHVAVEGPRITFTADADEILKRSVSLGEDEDSDDDSAEEGPPVVYEATFTTDQFTRISKIAGLSTVMQIFPGSSGSPLLFRTSVGTLGRVSVYIKSKELTEGEMGGSDSDSVD